MTLVILTQSINDGAESQFNSSWSEIGVTGQGTHLTFFFYTYITFYSYNNECFDSTALDNYSRVS